MTIAASAERGDLGAASAIGRAEPVAMAGLDREFEALRSPMVSAVLGVLESGRFILGPEVESFEAEIGAYLGGVHAVGCASGTDALVLALRALGVGAGDEVIVPAFTFAATAEAVVLAGATPVFADIERDTFTIDPRSVAAAIGARTRAILPVHLFGQCARMDELDALAARHGLFVVEDAAQAMGARWRGRPAGALGHAAAFSFHPTKNLGAPGDGGLVTTHDADLAKRLRSLRAHGAVEGQIYESVGDNSRLDAIHAAVLRVKLRHLDAWNARRRAIAAHYRAAARGDVVAPREINGAHHVYHHFTVRTSRRAALQGRLRAAGVGCAVYYARPLHQQPAYAPWKRDALPEAERASAEALSLPVHPWLTDDEVERVAAVLAADA